MNQAVLNAKVEAVKSVQEKVTESAATVVVEYRGLTVAEVTELRRALRAEGCEFKVYKNSISSRAVEAAGYSELTEQLTGPNAIAFSSDAVAPSRVLAKFAKKHKALVLKGGIVEGKVVDVDTLKELADLPNKEGMLAMLLGCLQSPVVKFACAVKAVADNKAEGGAPAPAEEPATTEAAPEAAAE
ncbi:MAG: 50S ribosomal protein L10 [Erysipelotrichaceae bacterium]|nr:50S ribosomal protein L10 [Erysipelotrichaceae bacterium]